MLEKLVSPGEQPPTSDEWGLMLKYPSLGTILKQLSTLSQDLPAGPYPSGPQQ